MCGAIGEDLVTEETFCNPRSDYGMAKLEIERLHNESASQNYEFINLRPTNIFGRDGLGLVKLIRDLKSNSCLINYLKSCLSSERRLNLVDIDLVITTIEYFISQPYVQSGQTYFLSQDNEALNNYKEVEKVIMTALGRRYLLPPFSLSKWFLVIGLIVCGRGFVNPSMRFSTEKWGKLKIPYTKPFIVGLNELIESKLLCND